MKKRVTGFSSLRRLKDTALLKITKEKLLNLLALLRTLVDLCVGVNTVTNSQELIICNVFLFRSIN